MQAWMKTAAVLALGLASLAAGAATHTLPLVLPAGGTLQGFVRVLNQSDRAGTVSIRAYDDGGREFGPVSLSIAARSASHFTSTDLERGNAGKGLSGGVGDGTGHWRLVLDTSLDIQPLAYIRTADGFVTSMHDVVKEVTGRPVSGDIDGPGGGVDRWRYQVPRKNRSQVSMLRLVNPQGGAMAWVTIDGRDDRGDSPASKVRLSIPAGGARTLTVQELEEGVSGLTGRFGAGTGKWQLSVTADEPILVVSLLRSPSGHLANLSTVAAAPVTVGDSKFVAVDTSGDHACGIRKSGTVECWGFEYRDGWITPPAGKFVAISGECGIRESGTVECWGLRYRDGLITPPAGKFVAVDSTVDSAVDHACGIRESGTVECWGLIYRDGLITPPSPSGKFTAISGTCGIRKSGTVECWGFEYRDGWITPPAGKFVAISGECGIRESGAAECWDDNHRTPPPGKYIAISRTCGILESGTVECWNEFGEPITPPAGKFVAVDSAGAYACGIRKSGTVECWGDRNADHGQFTPKGRKEVHTLPYVPPASSQALQGFVRVLNLSARAGWVSIRAFDDTGREFGPVSLVIGARTARDLTSSDLERGNPDKRLSGGVGDGSGSWRLVLDTSLDIQPLAYIRTADGFVTSMHDVVAKGDDGKYLVPFFNPGKNRSQVSMLRIVNLSSDAAQVAVDGTDDGGRTVAGTVTLSVPGLGARQVSAPDLEALGLGAGAGKWQLSVTADRSIQVVNLLRSPSGHLANLSTVAAVGDIDRYPDTTQSPRGRYAIPGIGDIPLRSVKVTSKGMQKMFVIVEFYDDFHAEMVGDVACGSYITESEEKVGIRNCTSRTRVVRKADGAILTETGNAPFTELVDERSIDYTGFHGSWIRQEIRKLGNVKIVNHSFPSWDSTVAFDGHVGDYLTVKGAGNGQSNASLFDSLPASEKIVIKRALVEDNLLFVAGWDKDAGGSYFRRYGSSSCKDLDEGCLWAQMDFSIDVGWSRGGTSSSGPNVAAALASVLAVFPKTTHKNLAKLAKACARRTGHGIERMLRESGGTGVADFACMKEIIEARDGLPSDDHDATTTITINDGHSVTVGRSSLVADWDPPQRD